MRTRVAARQHKETQRRKNALETSSLPAKLVDCRSDAVDRSELFIVEVYTSNTPLDPEQELAVDAILAEKDGGKWVALEAAIMAQAFELWFDLPRPVGYLVSALAVIPLVTHGITLISRLQMWTVLLKDALEQAFVFTCAWLKSSETVEVSVHTDFATR